VLFNLRKPENRKLSTHEEMDHGAAHEIPFILEDDVCIVHDDGGGEPLYGFKSMCQLHDPRAIDGDGDSARWGVMDNTRNAYSECDFGESGGLEDQGEGWEVLHGFTQDEFAFNESTKGDAMRYEKQFVKSMECYQKCVDLLIALHGPYHISVGETYTKMAYTTKEAGYFRKSINFISKVLDMNMDVDVEILPKLYHAAATMFGVMGEHTLSLESYKESLARGYNASIIYSGMAVVYFHQDNHDEAMRMYQKCIDLHTESSDDMNPRISNIHSRMAVLFAKGSKYVQALDQYGICLDYQLKVLEENDPVLADTYNSMGTMAHKAGYFATAMMHFDKSLFIRETNHHWTSTATIKSNMGFVFYAQQKYEEALLCMHESIDMNVNVLGKTHEDVSHAYGELSYMYRKQGRMDESLIYLRKHLEIEVAQERPRKVAVAHRNMAVLFTMQRKFKQAYSSLSLALSIRLTFQEEGEHAVQNLYDSLRDVQKLETDYEKMKLEEAAKIPLAIVKDDDPVVQEYDKHFKKKENLLSTCGGCKCRKKMLDMSQCSICKNVLYCSKDCQKKNWKEHKKVCQ
jgi:tetratricopeptide (TPR) repeat protein